MILLGDRIKETSTTTGTLPLKLDGAAIGFSSFGSFYSYGSALFYAVTDGVDYEVGSGQYILNGSDNCITRHPFSSSNNNGLVNFGQGLKEVFVTYPAKYSVYKDNGGIILDSGNSLPLETNNKLYNVSGILYFNGSQVPVSNETADNLYLSKLGGSITGDLSFSSTNHHGLKLNNLTNTQRNLLPVNSGAIVYNSTTNRVNVQTNVGWVELLDNSGGQTTVGSQTFGTANINQLNIANTGDIVFGHSTDITMHNGASSGTRIGTGSDQKLAFYGEDPIAQPSTYSETGTFIQEKPIGTISVFSGVAGNNYITSIGGHSFAENDTVVFLYLNGGYPFNVFTTYVVDSVDGDDLYLSYGGDAQTLTQDMVAGYLVLESDDDKSSIVYNQSTFTGNVGTTAYHINDIVKHLKMLGLIAR